MVEEEEREEERRERGSGHSESESWGVERPGSLGGELGKQLLDQVRSELPLQVHS